MALIGSHAQSASLYTHSLFHARLASVDDSPQLTGDIWKNPRLLALLTQYVERPTVPRTAANPPHAAAVCTAASRYPSTAARPTLSSKCEQCHVVSWRRKLNTDFFRVSNRSALWRDYCAVCIGYLLRLGWGGLIKLSLRTDLAWYWNVFTHVTEYYWPNRFVLMFVPFWNIVHQYGRPILNTLLLKLNTFRYILQEDWKVAGTCHVNSGWTLYIWNL